MYLGVVGTGIANEATDRQAEEVGRRVAEAGAVLVCGGLTGVMEAACRGARSAGGTTLGILPGLRRGDANDFVEVAVPTGMGEMRNALIVRAADALIAIGGEFGTLSEIALAVKTGKPVIGLGSWDLTGGGRSQPLTTVATPAEAVEAAVAAARGA